MTGGMYVAFCAAVDARKKRLEAEAERRRQTQAQLARQARPLARTSRELAAQQQGDGDNQPLGKASWPPHHPRASPTGHRQQQLAGAAAASSSSAAAAAAAAQAKMTRPLARTTRELAAQRAEREEQQQAAAAAAGADEASRRQERPQHGSAQHQQALPATCPQL